MPMKKGTLGNNSFIFVPIMIMTKLSCCAVSPLVKCKSLEGSDKASRIDNRYNMSKAIKYYQFSKKIPMKKCTRRNNSYISETILIPKMLSCREVCPLVKCKRFEEADKASRIYSGYNMSKS